MFEVNVGQRHPFILDRDTTDRDAGVHSKAVRRIHPLAGDQSGSVVSLDTPEHWR